MHRPSDSQQPSGKAAVCEVDGDNAEANSRGRKWPSKLSKYRQGQEKAGKPRLLRVEFR
jgi:hypothetical protein